MSLNKIGLNFEGLKNITAPQFNFSNDPEVFMDNVVSTSDTITKGLYGLIVLTGLFFFLYWYLTDKSQFGKFQFSPIRGIGISASICSILGVISLNLGYFTNFYHVGIFSGIAMLCTAWVWKEER